MSNAFLNALPPLLLLIIFGCTYWVYLYNYCLLAVKDLSYRIILILIHNIISLMFLWSFLATIFSSVGEIPQEYKFSKSQHNNLVKARTSDDKDDIMEQFCEARHLLLYTCTTTGSIRYCSTCMQIKPDRAHHCVTCEECFLRMDHHCPWVNNCIGFRNYKNFLLLIFYTCINCFFCIVSTVKYMISAIDNANIWENIPIGLVFGVSVVLGMVTLVFLCYHLYLVGRNETTLENVHSPNFVEEDLTFDLGVQHNYMEIFGDRWYLWFLPVFSSMGCGYMYLIARK